MFKRLTAILITLAMLFGMCAVVTADTTDPYEYLPRNITVACYNGDNSVSVAWINPTKPLTKVTVYDSDNSSGTEVDTEIDTVKSPTAGEISRVTKTNCRIAQACFRAKLVFEFTDGQKRIVYHTQDKRNNNFDKTNLPDSVSVQLMNDYNAFTTNEENATVSTESNQADKSLKIVSNISNKSYAADGKEQSDESVYIHFNRLGVTKSGSLKNSTTYKYEYKIKTNSEITIESLVLNGQATMGENSTKTFNPSNEWQMANGVFTTGENVASDWHWFSLKFKQATAEPFYIDDVKITELDSSGNEVADNVEGSTTHTYDFEDLASTQVARKLTSVTASGTDGGAEISWTPYANADGSPNGRERYVNVYEMVDGKRVLRARMSHMRDGSSNLNFIVDKSVYIDGLTNGKEYKFAVTTMTMDGIESEATEATVTPEKQVISKYEYEPANVMITGWRKDYDDGKGYAVSWINPTSDKLSSVKLYEINADGTETEKTQNRMFKSGIYTNATVLNQNAVSDVKTPGAVIRFENQNGITAESGTATYRLVFEFTDGQKRDIVYTGNWDNGGTGAGYEIIQTSADSNLLQSLLGYDMGQINVNGSDDTLASASTAKISQKQVKEGAQVSLELLSNQTRDGCGRQMGIFLSRELEANKEYNFSMDVNTVEAGGISLGSTYAADNDGNKLPNTNGKWQTITGKFTTGDGQNNLLLRPGSAMREVYIDNIKVWGNGIEESDPATYSFSNVAKSAPDNVSSVLATQGEKNSTTISWTAGGGQFVNVYEDIDENPNDNVHTWMFRARVPNTQTSVTLNNLETDKTHNFMVTTEKSGAQYNGLESTGVTCSATLVMPDYEINDVKLLAGGEEVVEFMPGGTYTAQANVTNAKIDAGLGAQVIVAVYADGVLENCVVSNATTIAKDTNETITVPNVSISNSAAEKYTVKIMVWKGLDSVTPLLKNSKVYTYNATTPAE